RSVNGEDLTLENLGAGTDTITLTSINGVAASVTAGAGQELVVAGTVEVVLDKNLALSSSGGFLGASTASGLPAYLGYAATISGKPQVGDEFLINTGSTGKGDNRNALALAALQTADTGRGGSSINEVYAQLVGSVGNKASSARIDSEAAQSLLTQTSERLSSVSGVNLDEEAARLLEYEQAYNASAILVEGIVLLDEISSGRMSPRKRMNSSPVVSVIHFSPRITNKPLGNTSATVAAMLPLKLFS
ncbi:hypothetical protein N9121_02870, partial [Pseudomonadales bacterium]|nr:hypothetical protein [Pseudomonadales bacterium]